MINLAFYLRLVEAAAVRDLINQYCQSKTPNYYINTGFEELDQSRLPNLINLKYHSMTDAAEAMGGVDEIRNLFFGFQKHLYDRHK